VACPGLKAGSGIGLQHPTRVRFFGQQDFKMPPLRRQSPATCIARQLTA
jgi:hypothetical protein